MMHDRCPHGFAQRGFCPNCNPNLKDPDVPDRMYLGAQTPNTTGEKPGQFYGDVVKFRLLDGAKTPTRAYAGDAGFDMYSGREVVIEGFGKGRASYDIPTGLFLALPPTFWGHIVARSSTFRRYGLHIISAVIDNGYRGEMFIQAVNPNPAPVILPSHTRIAQLILHKIHDVKWEQVQELPASERQDNGFGSSGQ